MSLIRPSTTAKKIPETTASEEAAKAATTFADRVAQIELNAKFEERPGQ